MKARCAPKAAPPCRPFTTRTASSIRETRRGREAPANGRPSPGTRPMMRSSTVATYSAKATWTVWRPAETLTTPSIPRLRSWDPRPTRWCLCRAASSTAKRNSRIAGLKTAYGTVNSRIDHTSICETSHHVGLELCFNGSTPHQAGHHERRNTSSFSGPRPMRPISPCRPWPGSLIFSGSEAANWSLSIPGFRTPRPKPTDWIPILPGTDAAFALGMMHWMMENDRVDKRYLSFPNQKAAGVDGHLTWCDSSYLVRQDNRNYLRPVEAGIRVTKKNMS